MRILIIEDNPLYRGIAAKSLSGNELVFATNYSEALACMRASAKGTAPALDGVISDLFFPATADTPTGENGDRLIQVLEKARREAEYWPEHQVPERSLAECGELLAPLGLQVFQQTWMYDRPLPIVILSQGDRHAKALGFVRFALENLGVEILELFVRQGVNCDKADSDDWEEAVSMLAPEPQMMIWHKMWSQAFSRLHPYMSEVEQALIYFS